jgi:CubicO group peptidase (beta-lactamase class C family)
MKTKRLVISIFVCLLLSACFSQPQPVSDGSLMNSNTPWPTRGWQFAKLADQGLDPDYFEQMQAFIEQNQLDLHSLLVVRHGYLVFEQYGADFNANKTHNQYSVTKSVVSTLVGIAIDQGYIPGLEEPVLRLLPDRTVNNVDRRKPAITLENVLTMTSGFDWQEGDPAFNALYNSPDWVQYMLEMPMVAEPGSRFLYCSGCSHLLTGILAQTTGQNVAKFAKDNLFQPLGITNYAWDTGSQQIPVGGWGLYLTPRDMAKIGYLYLMRGQWAGNQIVSTDWIDRSTRLQIETGGNLGYGYQWWIYPRYDAYTALGRYGQTIFVIPQADMVIVATAQMDNHDGIFDLIDRFIVPSILD